MAWKNKYIQHIQYEDKDESKDKAIPLYKIAYCRCCMAARFNTRKTNSLGLC